MRLHQGCFRAPRTHAPGFPTLWALILHPSSLQRPGSRGSPSPPSRHPVACAWRPRQAPFTAPLRRMRLTALPLRTCSESQAKSRNFSCESLHFLCPSGKRPCPGHSRLHWGELALPLSRRPTRALPAGCCPPAGSSVAGAHRVPEAGRGQAGGLAADPAGPGQPRCFHIPSSVPPADKPVQTVSGDRDPWASATGHGAGSGPLPQ